MHHPHLSPEPPAELVVRNLWVRYGSTVALRSASATVAAGNLVAVVGPNGAGKSTLLKAIAGAVPLSGGEIRPGRPTQGSRHGLVSYVPQREGIDWGFPVSALDVVLMGSLTHGHWLPWATRDDRRQARAALDAVGLGHACSRTIGELSGGQQQRVILARALLQNAPVLLLDEPLSGVDPATRTAVFEVLRGQCREGRIVIMATHDVQEAATMADRVWGVNETITADIPASRLLEPAVLRTVYGDRLLVLPDGSLALGDQAR